MASRYLYPRQTGTDFVYSDIDSQAEELANSSISESGISADNFPLLFDEVRQCYNVQPDDEIPDDETQHMPVGRPTERETDAEAAFEEAVNRLNEANVDGKKSCASCSEEKRVENVSSFKRGQHISMPGQLGRFYIKCINKLKSPYKHHAIVKEVKQSGGTRVKMVLIHFSKENGSIKIYESEKTYDLKNDEIYIIEYKHPRYTAEHIVHRAESMLPESGEETREFSSYNPATRNCEHFATWCVVGEGESFQVQGLKNQIASGIKSLFGDGSYIAKGILRLLYVSSDEIAASLSRAINVPEIVLGGSAALYLIYCIVMTALHIKNYKKGRMCWCCLKGKLQDLWLKFGVFGVTSIITFVIFHFALPLMAPAVGIPLMIILVLLSVVLQWSVSKIRKALQNPFSVDKAAVKSLSELNSGDVASLTYYGIEHVIIVSEVHVENRNCTRGRIGGIHYGLPHLFSTRQITEEYFTVDLAKSKVNLYDCRHLLCHPGADVVSRARKRVGEKKWAIGSNRSDHFCFWAKVRTGPSEICEEWDNNDLEKSKTTTLSSLFIEEKEAHLTSEIGIGDVVQFKDTGILVGKRHTDGENGRRCEIKMIVYNSLWYGRCRNYEVDLSKDRVFVRKYHPAHCHPMAVRAERAMAMKDRKGEWWTDQGFIEHCIMLNP